MGKDEMDFWDEQNNMSDEEFFDRQNQKIDNDINNTYTSDSDDDDDDDITSDRTHGSNGGLSDGSDSWKYGG
jgi:hypothetical protein